MKIYEITKNKKEYLDLLLLADEEENMVDKYLTDGTMFVIDDNGVKGEIVLLEKEDEVLEIKNLAVNQNFQKNGYAKKLIDFVIEKYKNTYKKLIVGTGDSPLTIPFYEKCGFKRSFIVKNFFVDNYSKPIIENGIRLIDMIYLERKF